MTRTILVAAAALLTASPAVADLCSVQWLQQASGRDVQRRVQATNADVNRVCNSYNSRPLHLALTFEGVGSDVVEALLNAGANIEQANSFGATAPARWPTPPAKKAASPPACTTCSGAGSRPGPKPHGRSAIQAGGAASTGWTGRPPSGASRPCCTRKGWTSTWTAAAATGPCTTPAGLAHPADRRGVPGHRSLHVSRPSRHSRSAPACSICESRRAERRRGVPSLTSSRRDTTSR